MSVLGSDILQKFKGQNQNTHWNITEEKVQKLKRSTCSKGRKKKTKLSSRNKQKRKEKKNKKKRIKVLKNKNKLKENEKKVPSSKIFQKN